MKDYSTVGLQFNWTGFDQTRKYVVFLCIQKLLNPNQPFSDTSPTVSILLSNIALNLVA